MVHDYRRHGPINKTMSLAMAGKVVLETLMGPLCCCSAILPYSFSLLSICHTLIPGCQGSFSHGHSAHYLALPYHPLNPSLPQMVPTLRVRSLLTGEGVFLITDMY